MIQPATLKFLKQLALHNDRDWFAANKKNYELAKGDFEENVQAIIDGVAKFDTRIKGLEAKKVVFRIYRDIRFSKDKSPYKINLGASFSGFGKGHAGGYYLHIQPGGKSMIGGGVYMPENKLLNSIRQEIDYHTTEFKKILNNKKFKQVFGGLADMKLKTAPKNFAKDHPEIELLKYTSFVCTHYFKDAEVTSNDFVKNSVEVFRLLKPLNDFLGKAMPD